MAQMIVRRIPDRVMDDLRRAAKERRVPVEALVRELLVELVDRRRRWREFARWSDGFRRGRGSHAGPPAERLVREDRER
jgi:plasmid stability protein